MTTGSEAQTPFFPGFKTRRITTDDGVDIHYVTGGAGPTLLLVHGAPESHIRWRRVAPPHARPFTRVIPDLRGYGRSGKPARADYSKRRMAADLIAVMDAEGHQRFRIAGHDRGARVTRRLVKDHEARIVRCAVLDIVPTAYIYANLTKQAAINMWNWFVLPAREPIPETVLHPQGMILAMARSMDADPEALADYLATNGDAEALHAMCEDYRAGAGVDLEHDAADADRRIGVPTLVVWGQTSGSTGAAFDVQAAWRAEASDLSFRAVETGHFMAEEAPALTTEILLGFFAEG